MFYEDPCQSAMSPYNIHIFYEWLHSMCLDLKGFQIEGLGKEVILQHSYHELLH